MKKKCKEKNGRRTAYRIGTRIAYGISFNGSAATGSSIFALCTYLYYSEDLF